MDSTDRSLRAFERREIPLRTKPHLPAGFVCRDTLAAVDTLAGAAVKTRIRSEKSKTSRSETRLTKKLIRADSLDIQLNLINRHGRCFLPAYVSKGDSLFNTMEVHLFYGYHDVKGF